MESSFEDELMTGNYVMSNLTKEIVEVDWLIIKHIKNDMNIQSFYDQSLVYSPIPVTNELMDRFGLQKRDISSYWLLKDWGIYYCSYNKGIRVIDKGWDFGIESIHQIQNYYFCITGGRQLKFNQ